MGPECTDLIIALEGCNDCRTETSRDADTESTDHAANKEIPDHVLFSPSTRVQESQKIQETCSKLLDPHLGATKTAITIEATIMTLPNTTNPTARNNF
jgi:hypothetical protein